MKLYTLILLVFIEFVNGICAIAEEKPGDRISHFIAFLALLPAIYFVWEH